MNNRVSIGGVSERDIDLLLLEEFHACKQFQRWFITEALGEGTEFAHVVSADRSVTHSTGESDLEVVLCAADGSLTCVTIENKIAAGLQPLQAERYVKRGTEYVSTGRCAEFRTVIVAPARYFGKSDSNKGFGGRVTYERLMQWFDSEADMGARRIYKVALLKSAIERGTLGYQPEEDAPTSAFWRSYWSLASEYAPDLEMAEPSGRPSGSTFIYFRPPALPQDVTLVHKFTAGFVDLQFTGLGGSLNKVRAALGAFLPANAAITNASKSAALRVVVPRLIASVPMEAQERAAIEGIEAANGLLAWFMNHQQEWRRELLDRERPSDQGCDPI